MALNDPNTTARSGPLAELLLAAPTKFVHGLFANPLIYLLLRTLLLPQCFRELVPNRSVKMRTPPSY